MRIDPAWEGNFIDVYTHYDDEDDTMRITLEHAGSAPSDFDVSVKRTSTEFWFCYMANTRGLKLTIM